MKWKIEYQASRGFIWVFCESRFSAAGCNAMQDDLHAQPFWQPGSNVLLDYRQAGFDGVSSGELEQVGRYHSAIRDRWGDGRMALLMNAGRDFGLARQYELLNESQVSSKIMVFDNQAAAFQWLDCKEIVHIYRPANPANGIFSS
jgi:hypothetical protein